MTPRLIMNEGVPVEEAAKGSAPIVAAEAPESAEGRQEASTRNVLITEAVKIEDIDRTFGLIAGVWKQSFAFRSSEVDSATLWALLKTGQARLLVTYDPKHFVAATAWRFERWANDTVFRCFSHIGMKHDPERWLSEIVELAKATAKIGGATRLIWEAGYPEPRETPDAVGFQVVRRTLTMEV